MGDPSPAKQHFDALPGASDKAKTHEGIFQLTGRADAQSAELREVQQSLAEIRQGQAESQRSMQQLQRSMQQLLQREQARPAEDNLAAPQSVNTAAAPSEFASTDRRETQFFNSPPYRPRDSAGSAGRYSTASQGLNESVILNPLQRASHLALVPVDPVLDNIVLAVTNENLNPAPSTKPIPIAAPLVCDTIQTARNSYHAILAEAYASGLPQYDLKRHKHKERHAALFIRLLFGKMSTHDQQDMHRLICSTSKAANPSVLDETALFSMWISNHSLNQFFSLFVGTILWKKLYFGRTIFMRKPSTTDLLHRSQAPSRARRK